MEEQLRHLVNDRMNEYASLKESHIPRGPKNQRPGLGLARATRAVRGLSDAHTTPYVDSSAPYEVGTICLISECRVCILPDQQLQARRGERQKSESALG